MYKWFRRRPVAAEATAARGGDREKKIESLFIRVHVRTRYMKRGRYTNGVYTESPGSFGARGGRGAPAVRGLQATPGATGQSPPPFPPHGCRRAESVTAAAVIVVSRSHDRSAAATHTHTTLAWRQRRAASVCTTPVRIRSATVVDVIVRFGF